MNVFVALSYMDLDHMPMILHIIRKVPNFKAFIKSYMLKGVDRLVEHTKSTIIPIIYEG
jgi:hypothetical protein